MLETDKIHCQDARIGLQALPDACVDCVVTSPPYWSLRDYGVGDIQWEDGSCCPLGLEHDVTAYIEHLCSIFDGIWRVLKPTGTVWVNLGDTYAGSWGNYAPHSTLAAQRRQTRQGHCWPRLGYPDPTFRPPASRPQPVKARSLSLVPARFALEMTRRGWLLRNMIVWHKPNHMPASVKNRFTNAWEPVLFFVKSMGYTFDLDAVREPHKTLAPLHRVRRRTGAPRSSHHVAGVRLPPQGSEPGAYHPRGKNPGDYWTIPAETRTLGAILGRQGVVKVPGGSGWVGHPSGGEARILRERDPRWLPPRGKNPGDCWEINTTPFPGGHFAVFPEALCERPIQAGCPEQVCRACGQPKRKVRTASNDANTLPARKAGVPPVQTIAGALGASSPAHPTPSESQDGSRRRDRVVAPGCTCNAGFQPGLVLDPFMGAGTTAVVAKRLGRRFLGFELNPNYVALAEERLRALFRGPGQAAGAQPEVGPAGR